MEDSPALRAAMGKGLEGFFNWSAIGFAAIPGTQRPIKSRWVHALKGSRIIPGEQWELRSFSSAKLIRSPCPAMRFEGAVNFEASSPTLADTTTRLCRSFRFILDSKITSIGIPTSFPLWSKCRTGIASAGAKSLPREARTERRSAGERLVGSAGRILQIGRRARDSRPPATMTR